ncbi:MAG: glycosyltransferase family 4 protein [Bacteroidota bacterium]
MRIGFDAKRAFYNRSGLGNYSRDTILSLQHYYPGNEYYLYTPRKKNPIDFLPEDKGNIHVVKPGSMNRLYQAYWRSISLGNKINKHKIDIYHGLSNELPADIIHSNARSVVSIHDLIFMRYPELYKSVDREIYQQKFFEASLAADKIIAMSEQTKEDIISFFHTREENIEVIYQGCNPIFYEQVSEEKKQAICDKYGIPRNFIFSVGTLEKRKNALQILEGIKMEKIDFPLVFVGKSTAYLRELHHFLKQEKMENQVYFLHDVPNSDLPALYQASSLFVYPSIFEGFGIPILEALNSGTPVITNKFGCFMEAGGDAAMYVNPNHPEEIGEGIRKILDDRETARKMVEAGKEHAAHFRQDKISEKLMNLYKSLL